MPTYVYEVIMPNGEAGERFEVFQPLSDAALQKHPETGAPVRRAIVLPQVQTTSDKGRYSKSNLERLGLSRFEKRGDGHYEKTAGQGPDAISAGD